MRNFAAFKPVGWDLAIDHADNLSRGLRGAWVFNEIGSKYILNHGQGGAEISTGMATMQTTPTWEGSPWGTALKFSSSSSDYATFPAASPFRATYPFSIACRAKVSSTGNGGVIWSNDDTANKYAGITLLSSNAGAYVLRLGDNVGVGSTHRKDLQSATAGGGDVWLSVAFNVYSISSFVSYLNGAVDTGSTSGTASALTYSSTTPTGAMGREDISATDPEYYSDHSIDYVYFWSGRSLSDADARNLVIDPYCIFERRSRPKYFLIQYWFGQKINNVANASISKVNGITKTSINKVNGVE